MSQETNHQLLNSSVVNGRQISATGLSGKRIVVTRASHQVADMVELLRQYGAEPLLYPCIDIVPPDDVSQLDAALREAANGRFDWLIVTSVNTVSIIARRLVAHRLSLGEIPVAAVGPRTARAVQEELGLAVNIVAEKYVAEELAAAIQPVHGLRILLPHSEIARPVLAETLRHAGAQVTVVDAYRTVIGQGGDAVPEMLVKKKVEAITFTSSSTVRHFLKRLDLEGGRRQDLEAVCLAAIGPVTAKTMEENGLPLTLIPDEYTLPALVAALDLYFVDKRS